MKPKRIRASEIRVRDETLVRVINGATKAGVHQDRKKQASKRACRKPAENDDE